MDPEAGGTRDPLIHRDPKPPPVTFQEVHPRDRRNHLDLMLDRKRLTSESLEHPRNSSIASETVENRDLHGAEDSTESAPTQPEDLNEDEEGNGDNPVTCLR